MRMFIRNHKRAMVFGVITLALLVAVVIVLLILYLPQEENPEYFQGAVTANGRECAEIGLNILKMNGSAADAAIATLFCEGVACPQSMGLGGGFLAVTWDHSKKEAMSLNARECAPLAATPDMFQEGNISSTVGGMASAVPGELRGYGELYARFGRLPWAALVQPSAELCRRGHYVTDYLARVLQSRRSQILAEPSMAEVFINPETGDVWQEGDLIKRPKLAETLDIIAAAGSEAMHTGSLARPFVEDVRSFGGIITLEDMRNYKPIWERPLTFSVGSDLRAYSSPLPGGGPVLTFIMNMLRDWIGGLDASYESTTYWHRTVEAFKYAYGLRTHLGDPEFVDSAHNESLVEALHNLTTESAIPWYRSQISDDRTYTDWTHYGAYFEQPDDHGTAHISVVAPNGDAVAVTSTINFILGAFRRSTSTGIILNNEMDDFSIPGVNSVYGIPPSPANFPQPNKRPLSSMCPTIVVNSDGNPKMVIGAAGGTKITTQVALTMASHLWFNENIEEAVNAPRLHHQLMPMTIQHETDFDKVKLSELEKIGHETSESAPTAGFAAITTIAIDQQRRLWPQTDQRRPGSVAAF